MAIDYIKLLEAFQPSKEMSDPMRFSGRKAQLEKGVESLISCDHVFIHGIRGIGKSSLARQLSLIAAGKNDLLEHTKSHLASIKLDYLVCFLIRDSSITNINQLLYRLLLDQNCFAGWNDLLGLKEIGGYDLSGALNPQLVSEFFNRIALYSTLSNSGVAIFIDEFELIEDQTGFASLIKANPDRCVFVVTGIGKTELDLVRDHESIERQISVGKLLVPDMTDDELRLIIDYAQNYISQELMFDGSAITHLIQIVKGQPYLLHLVGKQALSLAFKEKNNTITKATIDSALQYIALNGADRVLEERYLRAIGSSPDREIVLRIFAEDPAKSLNTSIVYKAAAEKGVSNPPYWVADLQKEGTGSELSKTADQYYSIHDPLFKAYIAATPKRLNGVKTEASDKHESRQSEFVLIQITDVHFGKHHHFDNVPRALDSIPASDKPSLGRYMAESLRAHPTSPGDFLAVTGDVTQNGTTAEFNDAAKCIQEIASCLIRAEKKIGKNLAVVPGNHDVNWQLQAGDKTARYLGLLQYKKFRSQLGFKIDSDVEPERLYEIHDLIEEFGVIIVGFNSSVLEDESDHRGYIGESQLKNVFKEIHAMNPPSDVVKIALMHHHLIAVQSLETSMNRPEAILADAPTVKKELLDAGFQLVLHGHRHFPHEEQINLGEPDKNLVIVGCGSTGVSVAERGAQSLQYNRVSIRRVPEKNKLAITVVRYMFDDTRIRWVASADHRAKTFSFDWPPRLETE